jgi:hypothetical protein
MKSLLSFLICAALIHSVFADNQEMACIGEKCTDKTTSSLGEEESLENLWTHLTQKYLTLSEKEKHKFVSTMNQINVENNNTLRFVKMSDSNAKLLYHNCFSLNKDPNNFHFFALPTKYVELAAIIAVIAVPSLVIWWQKYKSETNKLQQDLESTKAFLSSRLERYENR